MQDFVFFAQPLGLEEKVYQRDTTLINIYLQRAAKEKKAKGGEKREERSQIKEGKEK